MKITKLANLTAISLKNEKLDDNIDLLLKISNGDELAFAKLFEQYRNQLFTYLFKITKNAETSEEIVLDVFLKIWHGKELIPQIENFNAFLYRVAHNKAIDFLRTLKQNPLLQQQVWSNMQEPLSDEDADRQLLYKNSEEIIDNAIDQLSPQRQKVFYLHHHYGYSNTEIAQHLGLSKNTVRNHLFASLEFIRKFLSDNLVLMVLFYLFKKI